MQKSILFFDFGRGGAQDGGVEEGHNRLRLGGATARLTIAGS